MRRGSVLVVAAVAGALAVAGCSSSSAERPPTTAPAVRTDVEPLAKRLPGLGPIVSANWTVDAPAAGSRVPGPTDYSITAVLKLRPGGAARVLAAAAPAAASAPKIPTTLAGSAPASAQWVRSEAVDKDLAWADSAELHFDPATDTVYVAATNLSPQDAPAVMVHPDGTKTTKTPKAPPAP